MTQANLTSCCCRIWTNRIYDKNVLLFNVFEVCNCPHLLSTRLYSLKMDKKSHQPLCLSSAKINVATSVSIKGRCRWEQLLVAGGNID